MIIEGKAAETGLTIGLPLLFGTLPIDVLWIFFIMLGLILGWMARIGRMVEQRKEWIDIRHDLLVSLLIGGGNGLLATIIIFWFGLNYLQGVGVAFLCAFLGVRTLETAARWMLNKFLEDLSSKKGLMALRSKVNEN